MASSVPPRFDIVLWGATGFTGSLVTRHLLENYGIGRGLTWAIAGRDKDKLEALRSSLGDEARGLPILLGDLKDESSIQEMVRKARVVCSTVGPYFKYGSSVVAACAEQGVDYCDLAGEPHWIYNMIARHHDRAVQSGARIVCCCGFDSIPSDLGVHFINQQAQENFGGFCKQIQLTVMSLVGAMSGGTVASIVDMIEAASHDRQLRKRLAQPYLLNPPGQQEGPPAPDRKAGSYDPILQAWVAPFIMAGINTRVVRRSNALAHYPYGRDFLYNEATLAGPGLRGWGTAFGVSAALACFAVAVAFPPTRSVLRSLLPKPGEGPSEEQREAGSFRLLLIGTTSNGAEVRAEVKGDRDPGYGCTSRMLGESAVCLAQNKDSSHQGGLLTPATAMGAPLISRLETHAGMTFQLLPGS